jgi:putative NADPH-quinone reductase
MDNLSVILAHPRHGSFNHAIATNAVQALERQGHEVWFQALYQENFEPVLHPFLEEHCRQIVQTQGIVIVHPNWW